MIGFVMRKWRKTAFRTREPAAAVGHFTERAVGVQADHSVGVHSVQLAVLAVACDVRESPPRQQHRPSRRLVDAAETSVTTELRAANLYLFRVANRKWWQVSKQVRPQLSQHIPS
jgi:hypothetical protein